MQKFKLVALFMMSFLINIAGLAQAQAAQKVHIAVASNFLATLKSISQDFTQETGIRVDISNGASGMLYAQIKRGAPYDLFFSADAKRPLKLEQEGLIEPGSRFTYVTGRLVAWSPNAEKLSADLSHLDPNDKNLHYMAIANPKTAPYGAAALAVLTHYGLYEKLSTENKIALGENIGKAYQYTASGNAQLGLVAKSYVSNPDKPVKGMVFDIPENLYPILEQQAVVMKGKNSSAVQSFLNYFHSAKVQAHIQAYGYGKGFERLPQASNKE